MTAARRFRIAEALDAAHGTQRISALGARLDRGDDPVAIVKAGDALAGEIVIAIAMRAFGDEGPPLTRSAPRRRVSFGASQLSELFPEATTADRLALLAGLLQVLDQWEASHQAAQEADDLGERRFSPYWHAIAHRREPDAANAAYWFRRVGRHPVFADVEASARPLLESHGDPNLGARLLAGGAWDPMAFIAVCEEAAGRPGSDLERLARRIQRAEMIALLDATIP